MREGAAWNRLRKLLDLVQDTALVSCAFDAHATRTDSLRKLATRGVEVLRKQVAAEVCMLGDTFADPHDVVTSAISEDALARLFVGLGLDSRLRRHPQALGRRAKADVLRVLVAELDRGQGGLASTFGASLPSEDLLRGLAGALLQLCAERQPRSASADRVRAPDVKLLSLLRRGSARAIVARLRAMAKAPRSRLDIRNTVANALPLLCDNQMRLVVFMHVLQVLCQPAGEALTDKAAAESASLLSAVAEGIFISGIPCLPYENADQIDAVGQSPFLTSMQRQNLLELMMPEGACGSCGNTGIDMLGNFCDCNYGQSVGCAQLGSLPISGRTASLPNSARTGAHPNVLDLATTFDPAWARSNMLEPRPADVPPRPVSPNVRPISPGRFAINQVDMSPKSTAGSYVDRRSRTPYMVDTSPSSTAGSYVDRRPLKPYIDEHLRPWIPLEAPMRYDRSLSPRWHDATQKNPGSPLSQSERDDVIISNVCNNPYATVLPNDLLAGENARGYPRRGQEVRDDRALHTLCNNFTSTHAFDDYPARLALNATRTSDDYPARLALAATRFRELASIYESVPIATKQHRTSALLHQTDLQVPVGHTMRCPTTMQAPYSNWRDTVRGSPRELRLEEPVQLATKQDRTSALLNQMDHKVQFLKQTDSCGYIPTRHGW